MGYREDTRLAEACPMHSSALRILTNACITVYYNALNVSAPGRPKVEARQPVLRLGYGPG